MKLTKEQIANIANGVVDVTEENGAIQLHRFTEAQRHMYKVTDEGFYKKCFATAGIRLEFVTDSRSLSLSVQCTAGSSRTFFNHDIYVNGEHRWSLGGDVKGYSDDEPCVVCGDYDLGEGEKTVKIYFPWSVCSKILSMELDDGCSLAPVSHARTMLMFGDSITHGYDAADPSHSYASRVADAMDAFAVNKGIGGEVFRPALAAIPEDITPDIITVAYGTNDWGGQKKELFDAYSYAFYTLLSHNYPNAKIFAFSPVWRGNWDKVTNVGPFMRVLERLNEIAAKIPNMTVIDCTDFIPHDPEMFSPDVLHPNDKGFAHYAEGVIREIGRYI